jgi:hypothetical protein
MLYIRVCQSQQANLQAVTQQMHQNYYSKHKPPHFLKNLPPFIAVFQLVFLNANKT